MNRIEFSQSISIKLVIYDRVRTDGTSPIYLRITIDRLKRDISLKTYWPKGNFDAIRQVADARHVKDQGVRAVNLVLEEAKGRANRIKLKYFTEGKHLTLEQFAKEIDTYESRDNFLVYWKNKMEDNFNNDLIVATTLSGQKTNYNRLNEFAGNKDHVSMSEINGDFIKKFFNWLCKKKGLMYNSALKTIKTTQHYYLAARKDGFKLNPGAFDEIPKSYRASKREALTLDELLALKKLYKKNGFSDTGKEVLRKFLFSCYTGLRISDSAEIDSSMISNGHITVKMKKGRRYGKEVNIKLADYALELIKDRKGSLFLPIADPLCNRWLKTIAESTQPPIQKNLTFHVSRDTFATMFIELGGDIGTLKQMMGHSSINTTQIYMKMSENRADKMMDNFNKI